MTISRRENPVPTFLPAARLYLDDVEEIVRILVEPANRRELKPGEEGTKITFRVHDHLCDTVIELPKIAMSSQDFELQVSSELAGYSARLGLSWWGSQWTTTGLTKEQAWIIFRKLEAVFSSRKIRSPIPLTQSSPLWLWAIVVTLLFLIGDQVGRATYRLFPHGTDYLVPALSILLFGLFATWKLYRGPRVIFRNSWDHAARQREDTWKLIPVIVAGAIGLVTGVILTYVKHRFWP